MVYKALKQKSVSFSGISISKTLAYNPNVISTRLRRVELIYFAIKSVYCDYSLYIKLYTEFKIFSGLNLLW